MPAWGLTEQQIEARPWDLDPELLRPHKKITDPVHGDIPLTRLEAAILDSRPLQRLRRVRQLGSVQFVYPGATHSRFAHALGALRTAQDLMDVVVSQHLSPSPVPDLFVEWKSERSADYDRMVGQATVLARLGGLLHDLGHIPFGHTIEDELLILESHDANESRYRTLWDQLTEDLAASAIESALPGGITERLRSLILPKGTGRPEDEYAFVDDIVGNTICADLIDYLHRDHYHTGLPFAAGRRFLDSFYVTPSDHYYHPRHMVVRISRKGQVRADVISELFKYLRYRYELGERVLSHHAKLAVDVMIGKAMTAWHDGLRDELAGDISAAKIEIEKQMLSRSDDGILEYLVDESQIHNGSTAWSSVGAITSQIQRRSLFRRIGVYTGSEMSEELYGRYKSPDARSKLEREAAMYAGLDAEWMVGVWVPDPEMRFKPAEVLVDDGDGKTVVTLAKWDQANGRRGAEILESHRRLWAMRVYVDRRVSERQARVVLSMLAAKMGIESWDNIAPVSVSDLAAEYLAEELGEGVSERTRMEALARDLDEGTFDRLLAGLRDKVASPEGAALASWRNEYSRLEHRDLKQTIQRAESGTLSLDGDEYDVTAEADISRLNLRLFIRDLDEAVFGSADGEERIAAALRESPEELQAGALTHLASSAPAQRDGAGDDTWLSTQRSAVELAVEDFLCPKKLL